MKLSIKRQITLFGMFFLIFYIYIAPTTVNKAQVDNIWSVNKGDSRIYQIQKEFQGDFRGIANRVILEYYVMNNFDFNSNNFSDIKLAVTDLTSTPNHKNFMDLADDTWWYWRVVEGWERNDYVNMYFKGYSNQNLITTLERPFPLCWTFLLMPIKGNDLLHIGVNWTYSLNYINVTISNYLVYEYNNWIIINMQKENQLDVNSNTYYSNTGEIIWEKITGWLDSISYTRIYDNPLNYTIKITVDTLSSMTYTYSVRYDGQISNSLDKRDYSFIVYNIWDNDGNNYSELLYFQQRMKSGNPDIESLILDDSDSEWNWQDLTKPLKCEEIQPILPIFCDETYNIGLNWSTELYTINTSLVNYSVEIISNRVEISHWSFGKDFETDAQIFLNEFIVWDYSTGWLISYNLSIDHRDPLNYVLEMLIEEKRTEFGFIIDISLLIGIIGIMLGTISIILGFYILRKFRNYSEEEFLGYIEPSKSVPLKEPTEPVTFE